ncbi:putative nucleic acid-binding protein [Microbacterium sp. W4I4]|uniref:type II toxin-antitoxin system VapC family toxin n=1 Tax=Microbacterium sp. W4I4 TaxID=3042295 RepID=UPI0027889BC2|nr:type II toxin-antitoxin system VapC family toxin [Microbacterium sp. W4I4]MDQ0615224.1 putative nucleic acid-binding protein [Microbacterium sp. W4I4]
MAHYIDTSALVKLVTAEAESTALLAWIADAEPTLVASDLARTELMRAVRRVSPDRAPRVRVVLDSLVLLRVTTTMFETAGRLDPVGLRSLDALHLAAAIDLGDDLEGFLTYDDRLAEAARAQGFAVLAPTP